MRMFAAILWMFFVAQDKPVPPEPAKQPEPKAETQAPAKPPESMRVTIQEGQPPIVLLVQTNGERRTLSDDEIKQLLEAGKPKISAIKTGIVVENGKVYLNTGGIIVPLTGGGASGCFTVTPERNEQIQKEVRLQLEKEKADAEKKK